MALLERPPGPESRSPFARANAEQRANRQARERRWRRTTHLGRPDPRSTRSLLIALLLACATLITLDHQQGADSPVESARRAMGEVFGPMEAGTAAALRPVTSIPGWLRSQGDLRSDIAALEADNAQLRQQVEGIDYDRNRLAEYDGLTTFAKDAGYAMVPSRVIAMGPAQSFSRTVTIDAGSRAGVRADMTVVNNDGLVGRVLRTTRTTATVLLILDGDSVVGTRLGASMEAGYLRGRGVIGNDGRLDLELVDDTVTPMQGDVVMTWGSRDSAPYVAGIPIGRVTQVFASLREQSQRAVIEPYVDFSALDLVGVVVPSGTTSDRAIIEADGSVQP